MSKDSIPACANVMQGGIPQNSTLPIVETATNNHGDQDQAQAERPNNKYKYPEFSGPAGERYLLSLAQQFAPLALWRTWYAAVSYQAAGNTCYVGVSLLVDRQRRRPNGIGVGVKERKIYLDLQELEARGWLRMERVRRPFLQEDGRTIHAAVTEKDFSGFYDTAHDYHLWLYSSEYIEPERENVPLILADAELTKKLIRFENYRRLLVCGKPGPKKKEPQDFYTCQLEKLEQDRTGVQEVNQYFNPPANDDSAYRVKQTDNNPQEKDSSFSTSLERNGHSPKTIRKSQPELSPKQVRGDGQPLQPKPNPTATAEAHRNSMGGEAVKRAEHILGYTELELRQEPAKRGAAAAGIPAGQDRAEQEAQAQQRQSRPERERPAQVVKEVEQYAGQYDDPEKVKGDGTRAVKLLFTAQQALDYFNDTLFWAFYDEARNAAAKYAREHRNRKGRNNRVPYMFSCWENAFNLSLEELVYLRTEHPLYADYALGDMIDDLRTAYQEQYNGSQTRLDYREWLQVLLDQLEHRKEPKDRANRTMRDS